MKSGPFLACLTVEIFIDSLDHWCCKPSTDLNKSSFFHFRCLKWNPGRNQTAAQLHNRVQKEKKNSFHILQDPRHIY